MKINCKPANKILTLISEPANFKSDAAILHVFLIPSICFGDFTSASGGAFVTESFCVTYCGLKMESGTSSVGLTFPGKTMLCFLCKPHRKELIPRYLLKVLTMFMVHSCSCIT